MKDSRWDQRINRARELQSAYPFASEGLRFYECVARSQKSVYADLEFHFGEARKQYSPGHLRRELDLFVLLPHFSPFLSVIQRIAPAPLAQAAAGLAGQGPAGWQNALEDFWHGELELVAPVGDAEQAQKADSHDLISFDRLLAWIFLQPYAEYRAGHREIETVDGTPSTCPLCGAKPIVGVLRREGDGAKKSLICMLCAHEWAFRRIYCPACGEEREPQMAFYSAPQIAHVRADVCDTCHTYLKCIDLTKTGLAIPVVDELATIPLDLWAREHGYEKLQMNLLGT
jgi:formate dehydrogenase accessory protein FdhE